MKVPSVMLPILEKAVNRYLALDPVALKQLGLYAGKTIAIEVRGLDMLFYIGIAADGVVVFENQPELVDARLIGTPLALAKMGMSDKAEDSEKLLFSGDVEIQGDVEFGQQIKNILNEIEVDFEEQLSKFTGDVIAHQVGNLVRAGNHWGGKVLDTLQQDAAEYLQYETQQLPVREEVEEFLDGVDAARLDADRLDARVSRLSQAVNTKLAGKD